MSPRKKILWLVSWYPNKYDPFDGDFIQRHARAAALHHDIHVLFVKTSPQQESIETERKEEHGVLEEIIYLPKKNKQLGKIKSLLEWYKNYLAAAREIIQNERPALVHVHIPWKAGLVALWIKKEYEVPYVVTEHWGIYNSVVEDNIYTKPLLVRYFLKKIYKHASALLSVSDFLGRSINETLIGKPFQVIPNVVDTAIFHPANEKPTRFTFLHVSNMVPLKNVEGILTAFAEFVKCKGASVRLVMLGNRDEKYIVYAKKLRLTEELVFFKGEVPYPEVAAAMKNANVLVLNSRIENSPCVIGEALCCGLPVIATAVGGIPELINKQNGVLVNPNDAESLTDAMIRVFENFSDFKTHEIAEKGMARFGVSIVGQRFQELYITN